MVSPLALYTHIHVGYLFVEFMAQDCVLHLIVLIPAGSVLIMWEINANISVRKTLGTVDGMYLHVFKSCNFKCSRCFKPFKRNKQLKSTQFTPFTR